MRSKKAIIKKGTIILSLLILLSLSFVLSKTTGDLQIKDLSSENINVSANETHMHFETEYLDTYIEHIDFFIPDELQDDLDYVTPCDTAGGFYCQGDSYSPIYPTENKLFHIKTDPNAGDERFYMLTDYIFTYTQYDPDRDIPEGFNWKRINQEISMNYNSNNADGKIFIDWNASDINYSVVADGHNVIIYYDYLNSSGDIVASFNRTIYGDAPKKLEYSTSNSDISVELKQGNRVINNLSYFYNETTDSYKFEAFDNENSDILEYNYSISSENYLGFNSNKSAIYFYDGNKMHILDFKDICEKNLSSFSSMPSCSFNQIDNNNLEITFNSDAHIDPKIQAIVKADEIIELDENKDYIANWTTEGREKDGNYTDYISVGHYLKVTFEVLINKFRDIKIFGNSEDNQTASIDIYDSNDTYVTSMENITNTSWHTAYLTNLSGEENIFYLLINQNPIRFDQIVDPQCVGTQTDNCANIDAIENDCGDFYSDSFNDDDPDCYYGVSPESGYCQCEDFDGFCGASFDPDGCTLGSAPSITLNFPANGATEINATNYVNLTITPIDAEDSSVNVSFYAFDLFNLSGIIEREGTSDSGDTSVRDLKLSDDGKFIYDAGNANDQVIYYELTTPWDVSEKTELDVLSSPTSSNIRMFTWGDNGTKIYIEENSRILYQYNCNATSSNSPNLSTCEYANTDSETLPLNWQYADFNNNGSYLFIGDYIDDNYWITQHICNTPWNISTCNLSYDIELLNLTGVINNSEFKIVNDNLIIRENGEEAFYLMDCDDLNNNLSTCSYNFSDSTKFGNFTELGYSLVGHSWFIDDEGRYIFIANNGDDSYMKFSMSYPLVENQTATNNTNTQYNWSNLSSGTTYYWYTTAVDPGGLSVESPDWNFTTLGGDTAAPTTTIYKNVSQVEYNLESIYINWSASDDTELDTTIFNVTYPNGSVLYSSLSSSGEFNLTPSNLTELGTYNINLYANDSVGNQNSDSDSFDVSDTIAPYFTSLENQSIYDNESLSYTPTADDDGVGEIKWYINDTSLLNINEDTGEITNVSELTEGTYVYNISINDSESNLNWSLWQLEVNASFIADTTPPIFTTIPDNATIEYGVYWGGVDFDAEDETLFDSYFINDTTNFVINSTGYLNWTNQLAVGNYYVNVSVNDSSGNVNSTIYNLNVTKADGELSLTFDKESPQDYGTEITPTCSIVSGEGSFTLLLNDSIITSGEALTLGAGNWNFSCSMDATQNYTSTLNESDFVINKAVLTGSITGTTPITYGTTGDVEGSESNSGDGDVDYKLYRDGVEVSNPDAVVLGAGTYNYVYNSTGGANYSANDSIDSFELVVNQDTSACDVLFNETSPLTWNDKFRLYTNCDSDFTLYRNGSVIANNSEQDLSANYYNFTVIRTDSVNYSNIQDTEYFTIEQASNTATLTITPSLSETYGTETTASCSVDYGTAQLFRDGVLVSNPETTTLAAGSYDYVCNVSGNENYTTASDSDTLVIGQETGEVYTYLDNSRDNITINQGESIWINGSLITGQFGSLNLTIDGEQINYSESENISNYYTFNDLGEFEIKTNYSGNTNYTSVSESWFVTVQDSSAPTINIVYPVDGINYTSLTLDLNYTSSDDNGDKCWYSNNNGVTNSSPISFGTNFTEVIGTEGSNTWIVYCNDSSGNEGSDSVAFNIDTIFPDLTIHSPVEDYVYNTTSINLNVTSTAEDISTWWYSYDGATNTTFTPNETIVISGFESVTLYVYVNDTSGNENSSSVSFYIDTTPPTFISLTNQTTSKNVSFSYSPEFDDNLFFKNVTINDTSLINITNPTSPDGNTFVNVSELIVGYYVYEITIWDEAGNSDTQIWSLNVTESTPDNIIFYNLQKDPTTTSVNNSINLSTSVNSSLYNLDKGYLTHNFDMEDLEYIYSGVTEASVFIYDEEVKYQTFKNTGQSGYINKFCIQARRVNAVDGDNLVISFYDYEYNLSNLNYLNEVIFSYDDIKSSTYPGELYCKNITQPIYIEEEQYLMFGLKSSGITETAAYATTYGRDDLYFGQYCHDYDGDGYLSCNWAYDIKFNLTIADYIQKNTSLTSLSGLSDSFNYQLTPQYSKSAPFEYSFCANNSVGTSNCSETQYYYISDLEDFVAPNAEITSPLNDSRLNGQVTITATASDNVGVDYVYFQWKNSTDDWTNFSCGADYSSLYTCEWDTTTFYNSSEYYEVRAVPVDVNGNQNFYTDSKFYIIDRRVPLIYSTNVEYPVGQTSIKDEQEIKLYVNTTDSPEIAAGMNYVSTNLSLINTSGFINMTLIDGSLDSDEWSYWNLNSTISSGLTGEKYLTINAYDNATPINNIADGYYFEVNLDNEDPEITSYASIPDIIYNNTNVTLQAAFSDNYKLKNATLYYNNTDDFDSIDFNISGETNYSSYGFEINNTNNLQYYWVVYDDAGNSYTLSAQTKTIHTESFDLNITLNSPDDDNVSLSRNVIFNYSINGTGENNISQCDLLINGDSVAYDTNITNSSNTISYTFDTNDDYFWQIQCEDDLEEIYLSEQRNISINYTVSTPPFINIISPIDGYVYERDSNFDILFNIIVNDTIGIDDVWYYTNFDSNKTMEGTYSSDNEIFTGEEYYNSPARSYTVTFCAENTEGTENCSVIDYDVVYSGDSPPGGGGSGGDSDDEIVITENRSLELYNVTLNTEDEWLYDVNYEILVKTYNINNSLNDVDGIKIYDNKTLLSGIIRKDKGIYSIKYKINDTNVTEIKLKAIAIKGEYELEVEKTINLVQGDKVVKTYTSFLNKIKSILNNFMSLLRDYWYIFISIIALIIIIGFLIIFLDNNK
ncbi:MAG: Ig-like domain-containing protein [Bacillota bacterium]